MLKSVKNKRAQTLLAEYGALIILVTAATVAMTVYFKRAVQARIRGARNYMIEETARATAGDRVGLMYHEYEPYYTETSSTSSTDLDRETRLLQGGSTGIFEKDTRDIRISDSSSETLPPKDVNLTLP